MDRKLVNEQALNIDGGPMEAAMDAYLKEKNPNNMAYFMEGLKVSRFLVPVEFPKAMNAELMEKLKKGVKVTQQELPRMLPILLRNKQDEHFVPAYTSKDQIPKDHNYMAIMPVMFKDILRVAQTKEYKIKAICLNPHTTNMLLSDKFMKMMDAVCKGESIEDVMTKNGLEQTKGQKVTLTLEQFHGLARRTVEAGILPKYVFDNKDTIVEKLEENGAKTIIEMYRSTYKASMPFPYTEDDIDIMPLAIRDDLTIVSITFPMKHVEKGASFAAYIVSNPTTNDVKYYMIENANSKDGRNIGQVTPDGKFQVVCDAPASGSELSAIVEMFE